MGGRLTVTSMFLRSPSLDRSVAALSPGKEREVERVAMVEPSKLGLFTLAGFSIVIFQVIQAHLTLPNCL